MRQVFALVSLVVWLAAFLAGCGGNEPVAYVGSVAPTTVATPTMPVPTATLSGIVTEGGRPIENAAVTVQWSCENSFGGCSAGTGTISDAAGRYTINRVPANQAVWATANKDGYVQQCVATATTTRVGASLDLMVTSIASLSTARPLSVPGSRSVAGTVFEQTSTGRRPIEGASVEVYSDALYYADPVAFTRSDAAGHYLLCSLPERQIPEIYAEREGYTFSKVSVEAGTDATVDIKLTRQ
jgi:hypothetical protein